jgi:hypothetical protein
MSTTTALVEQNKTNYSDHQKARDNQIASQASVSLWKQTKNTCKKIMDQIDKSLTEAYIVYADAATLYEVYTTMQDIYGSQSNSLALLAKYPYAAELFYEQETKIVNNAIDLYNLIYLIIISYGEINKLKVSSRKMVFMQINEELKYLRNRCLTLEQCLNAVQFGDLYKNSPLWNFINTDKTKVQAILNSWKH